MFGRQHFPFVEKREIEKDAILFGFQGTREDTEGCATGKGKSVEDDSKQSRAVCSSLKMCYLPSTVKQINIYTYQNPIKETLITKCIS